MKEYFKKKVNIFRKNKIDNRGSGIITTLVAMIFLFSIASSLLMVTYTGYTMKVSQRKGNQNSQDATTAMDQIRIGLQNVVSDCMKDAYKDTLVKYSVDPLNAQQQFAEKYIAAIKDYTITYNNGIKTVSEKLINSANNTCNREALEAFIGKFSNSTVNLEGNVITVTEKAEEGKLILNDIRVTANNGKNKSTVVADISISVPSIGEQLNRFTMSGIPEFSIIAKQQIKHNSNTSTEINGSIYGATMYLGSNTYMKVNGADMVIGAVDSKGNKTFGDVDVYGFLIGDEARLTVSEDTTAWFDTMRVHIKSVVKLLGTTLAANDLDLAGTESSAILRGKYYGFGFSSSVADNSSSIFANGKSSKLDMTELDELTLSGFSFINDGYTATGYTQTDALMGESISSRENQRLYLVPAKHLRYQRKLDGNVASGSFYKLNTNPEVYSSEDGYAKVEVTLVPNQVLWTIKGHNYTYEDYGASVITMGMPYGSQSVGYYFLKFSAANNRTETENANLYFRHYFTKYPEEVKEYLSNYIVAVGDSVTTKTSGNIILNQIANDTNAMTYELREALNSTSSATISIDYALYQQMYRAACSTLTYNNSWNGSPFDYYIDTVYINKVIPTGEDYLDAEKTVYVVNGDCILDNSIDSSVAILIATGNVTLERNFEGTIFCGGDLIIENGTLTSSPEGFMDAYEKLPPIEENSDIHKYFLHDPIQRTNWKDSGNDSEVTNLVKYESWAKE